MKQPGSSHHSVFAPVTILSFTSLNRKTLVAVFDLLLSSGIAIYGVMLHRKDSGQWISFPGKPFQGKTGDTLYTKLIDIPDRATKIRFDERVLQALKDGGHIE
jgi:hypothetical protein